jgi:hypothetical protein
VGFRWWPWPRRKHPQVIEAEAEIRRSTGHREGAQRALDEARELGEWARQATVENRFDLRMEAAWRTRLARGERGGQPQP